MATPRQIVLDTETTGLSASLGDRVIEIGCIELLSRRVSENHFHRYVNPERKSEEGALRVHGLTDEFLADKPKFADIAGEFEAFVRDAELVIHNASFDVGFLDNELDLAGLPRLNRICAGVIDTLKMAKEQNPGKKASLDALCDRHQIDNGQRTLHGALLDAELLAEVYLAMTRGQESLIMALEEEPAPKQHEGGATPVVRVPMKVLRADEVELQAHDEVLAAIAEANKGVCLWLPPEPEVAAA